MSIIATVAITGTTNKETNLEKYRHYIKEAADAGAELILFPEMSLQGFPDSMFTYDVEQSLYLHETAELVPEGDSTRHLIGLAREYGMYIAWGMTERSHSHSEIIFNTAVLVGPEGYIGKYRKVHNPITERLYCQPGIDIEVFETKLGKIGLQICYDKLFPEVSRILAIKGAHIILSPTAWPSCGDNVRFNDIAEPARALENSVFFVSSNHVGEVAPNDEMCGRSRIIDPTGKILVTTDGEHEGMAIAEIDIEGDVCRARGGISGVTSSLLRDRRPDVYGSLVETSRYNFMTFPRQGNAHPRHNL